MTVKRKRRDEGKCYDISNGLELSKTYYSHIAIDLEQPHTSKENKYKWIHTDEHGIKLLNNKQKKS